MLFNSFAFVVFFTLVTVLYFVLPHRVRWFMLLLASCVFYMYFIPVYILILFGTIVIDYFAGLLIEKTTAPGRRKLFLVMSIVVNVGILAFFKYYNFFIDNFNGLAHAIGWNYSLDLLGIILPIGLSFHTFQAMSYTIEVYRGNQPAERHFGIYALYVMYYPQLVAGPIERPQNVLPQLHARHSFNLSRIVAGLKQMLLGFFKKMVIADNIADLVNPVYADPYSYQGITILLATVFFALQIFCDFSGYSDIALGASRVMGIELMQNFKAPFFSKSITEFWRRWHISLSTWFNDYLFTPIITAKRDWGKAAIVLGLFITFFLSGFWHGAGWTFIIYGCLHGLALIAEFLTKKGRKRLSGFFPGWLFNSLAVAFTFLFVCFSWIFFRAGDLHTAFYMAGKMMTGLPEYLANLGTPGQLWLEPLIFNRDLQLNFVKLASLYLAIAILLRGEWIDYTGSFIRYLDSRKLIRRWGYYSVLIYMILFFGVFHSRQEFIYFQF